MTVIAWDGKTLAADRLGTSGNCMCTIEKARMLDDGHVVAVCGYASWMPGLVEWYLSGAKPDQYPRIPESERTTLIVVTPGGKVTEYDGTPYPIPLLDGVHAWGSGREFAMGAMHAGADAECAALAACELSPFCGRGLDVFTVAI